MGNLSHKNQNLNLSLKISAAMSDLAPSLPPELITDIVLRLPAKSIGQSRCVSRPWRNLLSDPQFIRAHLTRHIHDPEKLILIHTSDYSPHILNFTVNTDSTGSSSRNDGVSRKVLCQTLLYKLYNELGNVEGSCHGLVLLVVNEENSMILINPTTLETERVSNVCLASYSMCGLGYDCSSDDYKIVALSYYDTGNEHERDCTETYVDIYSVKMKTWRRLENSPYDHAVRDLASGIFLNGAIHWLACDCRTTGPSGSPSVIAAFNLAREKFDEVPPPKDVDEDKFVFDELNVIGGCLAMAVDSYRGSVDVYLMKEYGKQDSWKKISIQLPHDQITYSFKPICLLSNEEMVLGKDRKELVLYNITKGTCRNMVVAGIPEWFGVEFFTFTESLLSPNFKSDYPLQ